MKCMQVTLLSVFLLGAATGYSQITLNPNPPRVIGHAQLPLTTVSPNLVEGRELYAPQGIALDTSVSPPIVYVSDANNNRVLAWKNATGFANGAPADLVIGQKDKFSTLPAGPSTAFSTGLATPTGLVVRNGALYVADSGNNRVLRFPSPFSQAIPLPDMVIGQPDFRTNAANSTGQIGKKGIAIAGERVGMAFDSSGNLWLADAGNRRVLRFRAIDIANGVSGPESDLVLGQLDWTSALKPLAPSDKTAVYATSQFSVPSALAFDSAGNLFVSDSDSAQPNVLSRLMVFRPPFASAMPASYIAGIPFIPAGATTVSQTTINQTAMIDPEAVFFIPGSQGGVGVLDALSSRILIFDPLSAWPTESTVNAPVPDSPIAKAVIGQGGDFNRRSSNSGQPAPSERTFSIPVAAVFTGTELYVVDANNNRVVVLPYQSGTFGAATRVLGQDRFDTGSTNLLEGREFQFTIQSGNQRFADAGLAIDASSDPPHLWVADPYNNRVLGFKDTRKLRPGDRADIVIGQAGMQTAQCNYPNNDANQPTQASLCRPVAVLVDASGNVYVADQGNGRVLRFPNPFARQGQTPQADLVLGQSGFTTPKITDPTPYTMASPYGLAFAGDRGLLVADQQLNRVLFFPKGAGDYASGMAAAKVLGQPDFGSFASGNGDSQMNAPRQVGADSDARPYVVDSGNNRVLIFDQVFNLSTTGSHAAQILGGISSPRAIYVSQLTGEIWVAANSVLRYQRFDMLPVSNTPATFPVQATPLALTLDQYGDLFVADASNRVAMYFPALSAINGANFMVNRALAPGMVASIFPVTGNRFGADTAKFDDLPNPIPLPKVLADIQVLFNNQAAPLYFVSPGQINFYLPMGAPTSGTAELQVVRQSTGQILGSGTVQMNVASPGIFLLTTSGASRQAAVLNQDNTVNGPTNAAARGSIISIYATGQGFVPNAPADGDVAQGIVSTPTAPNVLIGTCFVDQCPDEPAGDRITYSGLAPGLVGVWQVNVRIPMATAPGSQVPVVLRLNSINSVEVTQTGYITTIAVKP